MRVLFITPYYYPYIGGVEYVVKSIAERLEDSVVLCGDPSIKSTKIEQISRVTVVRHPVFCPFGVYQIPKDITSLKKIIKKLGDVEIVHVHSAHSIFSVYCGILVKKIHKDLSLVFTPHYIGIRNTLNKVLWVFWKQKLNQLLKLSKKVQILSLTEKDAFLSMFPFIEEKIEIIPNGVENDTFSYRYSGDGDYILFSGRIEKYKGLDLLPKLGEKLGLSVLIVGKGKYSKKLKKYKNVFISAPKPRKEYLKLIASARYAANTSMYEALSIFVMECMAIGTPIFVTKPILKSVQSFIYGYEESDNAHIKVNDTEFYLVRGGKVPSWDEVVKMIVCKLYCR